ncbi:MAG: serine hydrolase domain-containing protein [Ginsengibacter sp.]
MKFVRLLFIFLFVFQFSSGQTWQDTLSLIDKQFSQYLPNNPGCQLSISRNGEIIFSKAWGMADLERVVPLSTNSIFEAGSVSKQFTAAAILLLEQQGKLSLDDNLRKYIPELPDYGIPITLRQMLHHTSGIRDWSDIVELTGWPRGQKFYTNDDVLEIISHQKHLNNKPGDKFSYSNSNYILFAIIIKRVSGLSLAAFTQKYIFDPAGMLHTQWRDDPNRIVPNRAIAYSKSGSGFKTDMPNEYAYGHGGLLTTTEDLLKWNNFYQRGKFGTPSLLSKQIETEPLNSGVMNPYAAGLFINKVMGWDNISHDGATASYRAYLETFPELHLSICILSNTSQFNIDNVESTIRKIFVPYKKGKIIKTDSGFKLSNAYLNNLAGMYVNERNRSTFHLSVKGDTLMLDNYLPLRASSKHIFKADNFLLEINGTKGSYIPFSPRDTIPFTKVKPANLSKENIAIYEGNYFSGETNSLLTIHSDSSKLLIRLNVDKDYELIPTYKDAFTIDELGCNVQFIRSPQNKISAIKFYFWRTLGIEFKKIN